jgi:hypothetical protein
MTEDEKLYIRGLPITENTKSRIFEAWAESDDGDDDGDDDGGGSQ